VLVVPKSVSIKLHVELPVCLLVVQMKCTDLSFAFTGYKSPPFKVRAKGDLDLL